MKSVPADFADLRRRKICVNLRDLRETKNPIILVTQINIL